jgi:hypothetical protein
LEAYNQWSDADFIISERHFQYEVLYNYNRKQ